VCTENLCLAIITEDAHKYSQADPRYLADISYKTQKFIAVQQNSSILKDICLQATTAEINADFQITKNINLRIKGVKAIPPLRLPASIYSITWRIKRSFELILKFRVGAIYKFKTDE
jgi:hypothetical protein